jgi:L-lysine exporter family protein LysE/ArgO
LIQAFFTGFITLLSLILAVGAQNIFVLRQGLLRRHVAAICLFAALSDAILIWTGVIGFGIISTIAPSFTQIMTWIGTLFLATYGGLRFWAAYKGVYDVEMTKGKTTLRKALVTLAAFTLLNPHVYLDTLGLIGAVSTQYGSIADKYAFATGASLGSLVFFFGLGYGARALAPVMTSPKAWRFLDIGVGLTMWTIAVVLIAT